MADDATVTLSANDQISTPVLKAVAALQQLQGSISDIAKAAKVLDGSSAVATGGIRAQTDAVAKSVPTNTIANKTLGLVSSSMAELAGASQNAGTAIKIMDSIMFKLATAGGGISIAFIAVTAAAVMAGTAMRNSAEETRKSREEMDKLVSSTTKTVLALSTLDATQKSVAGVGAGQIQSRIIQIKDQINGLTKAMEANAAAASRGKATGFGEALSAVGKSMVTGEGPSAIIRSASAAKQVEMAGQMRVLRNELQNLNNDFGVATQKASAYISRIQTISDPLMQAARAHDFAAASIEKVQGVLGHIQVSMADVSVAAQNMGVSQIEAAGVIVQQTEIVKNAAISAAAIMGTALGNAISGSKNAWREGLKAMIGLVFDTATQVIIAAAIMNKAISLSMIPFSFVGILAMVAVLQAVKAVAMNALSPSAAAGVGANAASAAGISQSPAIRSGSGGSESTGPGGTAVSSAQREVVNNISVNLPIQALDLASISDMQLKNFANRVGRVIADAAGQGQFSLVGA